MKNWLCLRALQSLFVFASCFLAAPSLSFGQSDVGTITGYVLDQSGAAVPGANVTVTNEATHEAHRVTTDGQGHYAVPSLPPGKYTLLAESTGFKNFTSTTNTLNSNTTIQLNATLSLGQATETVEVSSTAVALQTESGAVQAMITGQQVQNQELNGRNPLYMAQLLPGVRSGSTLGDFNFGVGGSVPYQINGARQGDTTVTFDGAVANRTRGGTQIIGVASVDATEEIQVLTSNYAAEYGRASGGQVRLVSKSGTSDFHGSVYEYLRNDAFDANTWSRNLSKSTDFASPFRYNNFGFSVGGPVAIPGKFEKWRQKFFWFVNEDWIRYRYTDTSEAQVPTALMRQGNFSELLGPNNFYSAGKQIFDPSTCPKLGAATCQPFAGNVIPKNKLSPNGLAILNAYPMPNFNTASDNWIDEGAHPINQRKGVYSGDIIPTESHHITIRRTDASYTETLPFDQTLGLTPRYFNRPNQTNSVGWTYTITPTMINEARATLSVDDVYIPVDTSASGFNRQNFGINYPYLFPNGKDLPNKIPTINLPNFTSLSGGPYPSHSSGPIFTFSDSLTKVWGNHTAKFGFNFEYAGENDGDQINVNTVPGGSSNQNGTFTFTDNGVGVTSGAGIANAALGIADAYTEIGPRAYTIWRSSMFEGFAQDSWKVSSKFHIDYGMRISTIKPYRALWGNSDFFDTALYNPANAVQVNPATGNVILGTGNPYNGVVIPGLSGFPNSAMGRIAAADSNTTLCAGAPCNGLFQPSLNQGYVNTRTYWQPRVGVAYQLNSKTVFRAGIGNFVTRQPLLDNIFPGGNSPFQPFVTVNNVSVDNPGASLTPGSAAALTINTLNPNLKQPSAWNWNVTFERELPLNSILSVAYVAHRGLNGWDVYDINQPALGALTSNPGVNVNALRPYKGFAAIQEEESAASSMYNSLQISWNRRFTGGSMFGFTYTYSKSYDNSSNYRDIVPYTYNTSNLWGPSEYDTRHAILINYQYDLPFFKENKGWVGKLLGQWTISGNAQFQTGQPCGVGANNDYAGLGEYGSFGCGTNTQEGQFWNMNGTPTILGNFAGATGNPNAKYLDTTIFSAPAPGTINLQPGVRNSVYGPGFQNWNLNLFKRFMITEKAGFEFRAEAYNFINHPNWAQIGQAGGLNLIPTQSTFGEVTQKSTTNPRQLQLSLRFSF
jgi:hypothetical protein